MYLNFYNLKKGPFHITPDPEFLFLSPSHKEALASIIYGVKKRKGFVVILGEVGLGKTTILRSYLEGVSQQQLKTIYIFNANVSFKSLLKTIYQEMGLDVETDDIFEMVNDLHRVMIEEYRQGRNVVLVIDEAQNMPLETLENLRMLSNLETSTDKLIQIVLAGQPEFEQMLNQNKLRQLKQRIAIRSRIFPFSREESLAYIHHRLAKVAINDDPIFTKGALKKIVRQAKGIPRMINILCDNALITGFGYQKKPVSSKIVKEVIADFEEKRKPSLLRWVFAPLIVLFFIAGIFLMSPYPGMFLSRVKKSQIIQVVPIKEEVKPPVENTVNSQTIEVASNKEEIEPLEGKTDLSQMAYGAPIKAESEPSFPLTRVVKKGDSLLRLTKNIYNSTDSKVIERVKQKNPRIKDVNKILIGDEIVFPKLEERQ